ncbi:CPBP family intramembrane glutamic endopeptidase [uncultured Meiothermus sp.]|uniref:CPBP family intramembrane glutamic endopeptidase n=1 Tax=uncultured Meiothermus sp. TaxID=157471 RepID=UPI00262CDB3E|nr:CPBP family intramembrane glutamic endopeptidase [uncultured Meiothermus sp.]
MVSRAVYLLWLFYLAAVAGTLLWLIPCQVGFCGEAGFLEQIGAGTGLLVFAVVLMRRLYREEPSLFRRPGLRELLGLPLWSVPVSWCFAGAGFALLPRAEGNLDLPSGAGLGELLPLWVVVALVVPLAEETLFRGFIFRAFRFNDGVRAAVWLSAWLFALAHVLPAVVLYALGAGLIWGRYIARGGSLWTTIFAHAGGHSMPFGVMALGSGHEGGNRLASDFTPEPGSALILLGAGILLTHLFFRRNPLSPDRAPLRAERSLPLLLTLIGLGLAFAFALMDTRFG